MLKQPESIFDLKLPQRFHIEVTELSNYSLFLTQNLMMLVRDPLLRLITSHMVAVVKQQKETNINEYIPWTAEAKRTPHIQNKLHHLAFQIYHLRCFWVIFYDCLIDGCVYNETKEEHGVTTVNTMNKIAHTFDISMHTIWGQKPCLSIREFSGRCLAVAAGQRTDEGV